MTGKSKKTSSKNGKNGTPHPSAPHVTVVRVPMSRVMPHPRNPRKGNVEHIRRSLEEFGQYKPLVVQESTGHILAGNHTYAAAQELGYTHIDVHYQDIDDAKAVRLALADNGTGDLASWDISLLAEQLKEAGDNLPGFDSDYVEDIERQFRKLTEPITDPGPQVGRAEEMAQEWGVEEGQVWVIPSRQRPVESHRLVCGDCTMPEVVERVLAGARPKLMVTDPPYGVEYDPGWREKEGINWGGPPETPRRLRYIENDDRADWTEAWALFPGDVAYIWHSGLYTAVCQRAIEQIGFEIRAQIIWRKPGFVISRGHYNWAHEPLLYCVKKGGDPAWKEGQGGETLTVDITTPQEGYFDAHQVLSYVVRDGATAKWIGDHAQSTVWNIPHDETADGGHATQKPLECMERPIRNHDGDVYEPFCGSGTTLIAAERQARICYAIELLPECVGIILQRCKDFGLEPELSSS